MRGLSAFAVLVVALAAASAAVAGNPWDGGIDVGSPIELALTNVTSTIAGVPAPVVCSSPSDWVALTSR